MLLPNQCLLHKDADPARHVNCSPERLSFEDRYRVFARFCLWMRNSGRRVFVTDICGTMTLAGAYDAQAPIVWW